MYAGTDLLLLQVAAALMAVIRLSNVLLRKPLIDSVLFSLAIAVGITPQLLPAVVSTSLATGSRQLAKAKVLVKRLVGMTHVLIAGGPPLAVIRRVGRLQSS